MNVQNEKNANSQIKNVEEFNLRHVRQCKWCESIVFDGILFSDYIHYICFINTEHTSVSLTVPLEFFAPLLDDI